MRTAFLVTVFVLLLAVVIVLMPKFANMSAEYGTARAIADIGAYVRDHQGKWPAAAEDLQSRYPPDGKVFIDYSAKAADIIDDPERLREAVRPRSGRFLTYPHYERDLAGLRDVVRESNRREAVKP